MAAGLHRIGPADQKRLIGAEEDITLRTALEWSKLSRGEFDETMERISRRLYQSADAVIFHSMTLASVHIHVANYYYTAATRLPLLLPQMAVEAKRELPVAERGDDEDSSHSVHYHKCTITAVHVDGTSDIRFDRADFGSNTNVEPNFIRAPRGSSHKRMLKNLAQAYEDGQTCKSCIEANTMESCSNHCAVCNDAAQPCGECTKMGYISANCETRPCTNCLKRQSAAKERGGALVKCTFCFIPAWESDKEASQVKAIDELCNGGGPELLGHPPRHGIFVRWIAGVQHQGKSAVAPIRNYYMSVDDDIICIIDVTVLWIKHFGTLRKIMRKEDREYKDRHSFMMTQITFGETVAEQVENIVVKVPVYPEKAFPWRSHFQSKKQDLLVRAHFIAMHEIGTLLITDRDGHYVLVAKLTNPVNVEPLAGKKGVPRSSGEQQAPQRCSLTDARFSRPAGIDFLARCVAIVADQDAGDLRVLHFESKTDTANPSRYAYGVRMRQSAAMTPAPSSLRWRPFGITTVKRFLVDRYGNVVISSPAQIAVTLVGSSDLYLVDIVKHQHGYNAVPLRLLLGGSAAVIDQPSLWGKCFGRNRDVYYMPHP